MACRRITLKSSQLLRVTFEDEKLQDEAFHGFKVFFWHMTNKELKIKFILNKRDLFKFQFFFLMLIFLITVYKNVKSS